MILVSSDGLAPAVGVDTAFESSDDAGDGSDCTIAGDSLTGFEVPNEKPLGDPKAKGTANGDDDDSDDDEENEGVVVVVVVVGNDTPPEN